MTRTLAIGDIHGCKRSLDALLEAVSPAPDDTIVTLGDYVDRGPDSHGVVAWALERSTNHGLIALLGNHEIMMMEARENARARNFWFQYGGVEALESYVRATGGNAWGAIPQAHWDFFDRLQPYHETDTHLFVHAGIDPNLPMGQQSEERLFWERFHQPVPHESGKVVVCGHTIQADGRPANVGHAVCIDTGSYERGGWLTCLDTGSGHYWQANEQGEIREDDL